MKSVFDNDIFNIGIESADFESDGLEQIRYGSFKGRDGQTKYAAFMITGVDKTMLLQTHSTYDPMEESNKVLESGAAMEGAKYQAYEWSGSGFEPVDVDEQDWFTFS